MPAVDLQENATDPVSQDAARGKKKSRLPPRKRYSTTTR